MNILPFANEYNLPFFCHFGLQPTPSLFAHLPQFFPGFSPSFGPFFDNLFSIKTSSFPLRTILLLAHYVFDERRSLIC